MWRKEEKQKKNKNEEGKDDGVWSESGSRMKAVKKGTCRRVWK